MNDADQKAKTRNREVAQNEKERQAIGDIRVSVWAVAIVVIIGLATLCWVLINNN